MKWFGTAWSDQGICADQPADAVPIGQVCPLCRQPIKSDDRGVLIPHLAQKGGWVDQAWHISCFHDMLASRVSTIH